VHWKKGPHWWLKVSHHIFFVVVLLNYIIIPGGNIVLSLYLICDPNYVLREQMIESYVVFFMVVCVGRLLEYFVLIRRTVLTAAKNHLIKRE
jgi:hypothetical protein